MNDCSRYLITWNPCFLSRLISLSKMLKIHVIAFVNLIARLKYILYSYVTFCLSVPPGHLDGFHFHPIIHNASLYPLPLYNTYVLYIYSGPNILPNTAESESFLKVSILEN